MRQKPSKSDRSTIEDHALLGARSLVDRMRTLYRELELLTDAPITLHRALHCVGEEPGLTASQLALRLGMKRPAVSQLLKNLAGRGWIERRRSEGDQRSVNIHVTADGRQILKITSGRAVGMLKRAVQSMKSEDVQQLATGLEALLANLPSQQPSKQKRAQAIGDIRRASAVATLRS